MPSIGSFKAQPVTRSFVVTQDTDNDEYGAYYFTQSTIDAWYAAHTDELTKVSEGLYVVTGNFYETLHSLNSNGTFEAKRSLRDMGKEIVIGNTIDSRLIVLRKVQDLQNPAFTVGGGVGYIVVESNYRSSNAQPPSSSRFNVNVARA